MRKLKTQQAKNQFLRIYSQLPGGNIALPEFHTESLTYKKALSELWNCYKGKDMTEKVLQGVYNMILSHYAATPLDDLPKGHVGYVLGRKKAFNIHINKVFKARGLVWEKEDPSKADFFIVGDILKESDNLLNVDLSKPIVMDITIENEYHHNHSKVNYISAPRESILTSLFNKTERKDMDILANLLKFVHAESLSNVTRTRMVLHYLKCVGMGFSYSDTKHKALIRLLRRVTLPQHQFLLEPKFSNSYTRIDYNTAAKKSNSSVNVLYNEVEYFGYLGIGSRWGDIRFYIPMEEDTLDLFDKDIIEEVNLTRELSSLSKGSWETSYSTRKSFEGISVTAQSSYQLMKSSLSVSITYFESSTGERSLMKSEGSVPECNSYGRITSASFYSGIISDRYLKLMKSANLNDPKYSVKNLDSTGWTESHFEPIKKKVEQEVLDFCKKYYGDKALLFVK